MRERKVGEGWGRGGVNRSLACPRLHTLWGLRDLWCGGGHRVDCLPFHELDCKLREIIGHLFCQQVSSCDCHEFWACFGFISYFSQNLLCAEWSSRSANGGKDFCGRMRIAGWWLIAGRGSWLPTLSTMRLWKGWGTLEFVAGRWLAHSREDRLISQMRGYNALYDSEDS